MAWMELLDANQQGFNNFINTLMQIQNNKAAQYNAGLDSKIEQLMNMKEFDPDAIQGPIDAFLYDMFKIKTKDTKGVEINEALDKADLHRYGTDYSDIFDFSQPKRTAVAQALFGDYDPTLPSFNERIKIIKRAQNRDKKRARLIDNKNTNKGFEPMGKNVSATISKNKNYIAAPKTNVDTAELIKLLQNANPRIFDNSFLKDIQANNRLNMNKLEV